MKYGQEVIVRNGAESVADNWQHGVMAPDSLAPSPSSQLESNHQNTWKQNLKHLGDCEGVMLKKPLLGTESIAANHQSTIHFLVSDLLAPSSSFFQSESDHWPIWESTGMFAFLPDPLVSKPSSSVENPFDQTLV